MANTYDKASLVLIPSGTKESLVFSQKPTNGDGDFTFSRSTSATRVGPSGYIEKETQNLLLQSNQFDTTWVSLNTTETGGQSGYDGSSDAWLITKSASAARIYQTISVSGVQTYSVYAKAGTLNWVAVSNNLVYTYFNLSAGTIGTNVGTIDANIEDVGSGWYRCSITYNGSATDARIYPSQGDNDSSGTSGSIYIQDAQLEQGLVARDYIETTTSAVYGGITDNIPRLDYTDASCPSLKLEPQRTNLVENSEYHSDATYGNNNVTTTDNEATSPEGVQNAAKIVLDSGTNISNGGHHYIFNSTGGTTYTISVFAKAGEYRYFTFTYGSVAAGGGHFDLQEGTLLGTITNAAYSNETASIEDYGNGWYRLVVSLRDNASVTGRFLSMKPSPSASVPSNNNYSSTGDGTSGAYIYGFQIEESSYPTSYIPTYGTSVTFASDVCNNAGNASTFNDSEGVLYAEIAALVDDLTQRHISTSDGSITNVVRIHYHTTSNSIRGQVRAGGSITASLTHIVSDITDFYKVAISYKENDVKLYINGVEVATDTNATMPTGLDELSFNRGDGGLDFYGNAKQVLYFPTALSDEELEALTTL